LGAALAALVGLYGAWRSFQRQIELNQLQSNFVSSVSHELRSPIASVRLLAESLDRGKVSEPGRQREYFALIVRECQRLSSLITNALDFSRMDQGRQSFEFEPADVAALMRHAVQLLEPVAEDRQVTLRCHWPDPFPPADGAYPRIDAKALQQALVNLIDNAIKHSPAGQSVTVGLDWPVSKTSAASSSNLPPGWFAFWVEDHGPGIPLEDHQRIFEPFYRRGSELRRETQGVGIGLSIVKHVADAHQGRVRVESEPGHGSKFIVELPIHAHESFSNLGH
jgi:signal transduction histidine kinase